MSRLVALDSNLLLLYIVGTYAKTSIAKVKRLRAYSVNDFNLLTGQLQHSAGLVLTPNTITEISNLLRSGARTAEHAGITKALERSLHRFGEQYIQSTEALARTEGVSLGVTDATLLILAQSGAILLTADLDLYLAAIRAGYEAINFNHVRNAYR